MSRIKRVIYVLSFAIGVAASALLLNVFDEDSYETAVEQSTHPAPTPTFVRRSYYLGASRQCVELDEWYIWEVRDEGNDVFRTIERTIRVSVDGLPVHVDFAFDTVVFVARDGSPTWRIDAQPTLGSHGGGVTPCLDIDDLELGLHLASIRFSSTRGREFEYTWPFVIPAPRTATPTP
jgi:hypothetical protein